MSNSSEDNYTVFMKYGAKSSNSFLTATLPNSGSVNLANLMINLEDCVKTVILEAVINWSVTFSPPANTLGIPKLVSPGTAIISFEFISNGTPIYTVYQSASQSPNINLDFTNSTTTYSIASLLHFDEPIKNSCHPEIYMLRASEIILTPPKVLVGAVLLTGNISAAVGALSCISSLI